MNSSRSATEWTPSEAQDAVSHVLETHQRRSLKLQAALRMGLVLVASTEVLVSPPTVNGTATAVIMTVCLAYAVVMIAVAWRAGPVRHVAWAVPLVDLPVLALWLAVSGAYSDPSWSNPFTSAWLIMVTIMAAFQLRPVVTAVTGAAATTFYCVATLVGHAHAQPDLHFTVGHTLSTAIIALASVLISWVQQSRVRQIADLASRRASILASTLTIADRDRRNLAEVLHDGPLQSVLAARLDLDEAASEAPHEALARADEALRDAARYLRSSVTELYPPVLDTVGLPQALADLAQQAGLRGKFTAEVSCTAQTAGYDEDRLLYSCARELLANVVKHARADRVDVRFGVGERTATLSVSDDGIGISETASQQVAHGHIGLASQRLRLQAAGGALILSPNTPTGTTVEVHLPLDAAS